MTTEKQFAANRANAQQSTGPKTDAGKTATSHNAVKHNLTSKYLIIIPGQQDAFAGLEAGLRSKLNPNGPLEEVLYKRAVECAWNLERCRMAEAKLQNESLDPHIDSLLSDRATIYYDRVRRYARESENSLYKAMRELGKLQTEAQYRQEICPLTVDQLADPAQVAQTVHSLSQTCMLNQIMKHVLAFHQAAIKNGAAAANRQFEAIGTLHPLEYQARVESAAASAPPPSSSQAFAAAA